MGLGSRNARLHQTAASQRIAGADHDAYWEHKPGETVMTADGFLGTVRSVLDGPVPGNEIYEVTLHDGVGGGQYTASQLTKRPSATASVEASTAHTADVDYPELGNLLIERPDIAIDKTSAKKAAFEDHWTRQDEEHENPFDPQFHDWYTPPEDDAAHSGEEEDEDSVPRTAAHYPTGWFPTSDLCEEDPNDDGRCAYHDEYHDEAPEPEGPEHDDARVEIGTNRWGNETAYHAHHGRDYLGHFPDEARARAALWDHSDKVGFYPNHWVDGHLDTSSDAAEYARDKHGWLMRNSPSYEAEQTKDVGHDVDEAMEGSEHLKGLLHDNKIGPSKYSLKFGSMDRYHDDFLDWDGEGDYHGRTFKSDEDESAYNANKIDAWGRPVRQPFDGHGAWDCNNYQCTEHPMSMYQHTPGEMPGWLKHDTAGPEERDLRKQVNDSLAGNEWLLDQQHTGPTKHSSLDHLSLISEAARDEDFRFHFTASWSDVRQKAQRLRGEDRVRIVAAHSGVVVAEVRGDHHTYETGLQYVPGARKVATWQCGCKWAAYAWGRSPKYKRFEGRMCSHALAVQYEAQSRGMFGRDIKEDSHRMPGQHQRTPVVVEYDKDTGRNRTRRTVPPGNMRTVWSKTIEPAPVVTAVAALVLGGEDADEVGLLLRTAGIAEEYVGIAKAAAVNDAWGDGGAPVNIWAGTPSGATKPRDPQDNPASSGWASSPDPTGWSSEPLSMGDRTASHYSEEAEDGDTDVCANCGESIKRTTIDPGIPWVHHHSGNAKCDVSSPADAVMLQGIDSGFADPVMHAASMNDEDAAVWDAGTPGAVATLHDEPEGALPTTDGGMDESGIPVDQSGVMTPSYDDALSPENVSIQSTGSVEDIVAEFQRTAGASALMSGGRPSSGPASREGNISTGDIAAAARAQLEKMALKAFSPAEQRALIEEPGNAANDDRLDIEGTHYAALEAMDQDEDGLGILW